jgi:hypothetical protein
LICFALVVHPYFVLKFKKIFMQRKLLLGVEAIGQAAIDAGISGFTRIPELRQPKSQNTFRKTILQRNATFTGSGRPTKKRQWKPHWA